VTINDLLKLIPEHKRDYFIVVSLPALPESREEPLIEVTIDDVKKHIILEGDTF
jgi:hypothetical protein